MSDKNILLLNDDYEKNTHNMGRVTLFLGFLLSLLPPLILWLSYGIFPPLKNLVSGFLSITTLMLPVSVVEVLTFAPILGAGAIYMSYLTGNISNLKIPSAAIALETVDVQPSTREGDIIANLAIAGSVLAGEIILILGVVLIAPLSHKLNSPVIRPAFEQILPALFGSIGAYYILKEWKLAIAPLVVAILINCLAHSLPTSITIPVCMAVSVIAARFLYNKRLIKTSERIDD